MLKFIKITFILGVLGCLIGAISVLGLYLVITPNLPSIENLKDIRLQEPLRVYSRDGKLIAEYGEKRRIPLNSEDIPVALKDAVIAAEDDRFEEHPGVDYQGLLRAGFYFITTGTKAQGGSTITMQVARNFFLSSEKTFLRKFNEIFLALRIEKELSKDKILELYLNKIYLGKRAYGVASAAQVYYGKTVHELSLAEIAMIAGLPKAPSTFNPVVNPERATQRRNYVLGRMLELGKIEPAAYEAAIAEPVSGGAYEVQSEVEAPYVGEMVRAFAVEKYGEDVYTSGLKIYATIDSTLQTAANAALRNGLLDYEQRHGYRGIIASAKDKKEVTDLFYNLGKDADQDKGLLTKFFSLEEMDEELEEKSFEEATGIDQQLQALGSIGGLMPAAVADIGEQITGLYLGNGKVAQLSWEAVSWASKFISVDQMGEAPAKPADVFNVGDIIWVRQHADKTYSLSQLPAVSGAFVALNPQDGSILSLVGGFDFFESKFNRVLQAKRQPGSSFKPFIYSAALANGYTPASVFNDAPVVFDDPALEDRWRPENYTSRFYGPTRLREALINSRNLVSIRVLLALGISKAQRYVKSFGFSDESLPRDLSLALGSGSLTPLELTRGFSVFANKGYLITPYFIEKILDSKNAEIYRPDIMVVCEECESEVLTEEDQSIDTAQAEEQLTEQTVDETELEIAAADPEPAVSNIEAATENLIEGDSLQLIQREAIVKPAKRVMDARTNFLINSILRDVIIRGTGVRARELGRNDLAGKTGTTNDQHDAWFAGYNHNIVATAWVGYDGHKPLGSSEAGGRAALPVWMEFMSTALKGMAEVPLTQPEGLVTVRIDPETGLLADSFDPDAIFETFRIEDVPTQKAAKTTRPEGTETEGETINPEGELF